MARESSGMDELSVSDSPITPASQPTQTARTEQPAPALEQVDSGQESFFEDEAPVAAQTRDNGRSVKVRADKGDREFNLDPNDKDLLETLAQGVRAKRYKAQSEITAKELKQLKTQFQQEKADAEEARAIKSLVAKGYKDQAIRKLLGEDGYRDYLKSTVTETIDYENGDDLTKNAIEKARLTREAEYRTNERDDRIKQLEDSIAKREDAVRTESFMSEGKAALREHSFTKYVKNPELADKLDQKLWKLTWSDLEEMVESQGDDSITPNVIRKTLAENAKILRAGMAKASKTRANAIVEQKKDNAKKTAASIMSSRSTEGFDASQWDGKDPKELLRLMTRR